MDDKLRAAVLFAIGTLEVCNADGPDWMVAPTMNALRVLREALVEPAEQPTTRRELAAEFERGRACGITRAHDSLQQAQPVAQDRSVLNGISEKVTIMLASAQAITDDGDWITGYTIKTGALHSIIGMLQGAGVSVIVPRPASTATTPPVPHSGADETPPVFGRRWSLSRDGFGLERDDLSGNYVHIDDALSVLHMAQQAEPLEPLHSLLVRCRNMLSHPAHWGACDGVIKSRHVLYADVVEYLSRSEKRHE